MNTESLTYPPLSPYLTVKDAAKAIEFYKKAFGATERYRLTDSGSGRIGHAEMTINGGLFMISDEFPEFSKSPETVGGSPVKFCLMVEDADAVFERAVAAGATVESPMADQFYGYRSGCITDPSGHGWMIQHEIEKVSPADMQKRWDEMVKNCQNSGA